MQGVGPALQHTAAAACSLHPQRSSAPPATSTQRAPPRCASAAACRARRAAASTSSSCRSARPMRPRDHSVQEKLLTCATAKQPKELWHRGHRQGPGHAHGHAHLLCKQQSGPAGGAHRDDVGACGRVFAVHPQHRLGRQAVGQRPRQEQLVVLQAGHQVLAGGKQEAGVQAGAALPAGSDGGGGGAGARRGGGVGGCVAWAARCSGSARLHAAGLEQVPRSAVADNQVAVAAHAAEQCRRAWTGEVCNAEPCRTRRGCWARRWRAGAAARRCRRRI